MGKINDRSIKGKFGVPETVWNRLVEEFKTYRSRQDQYLVKFEGKYLILHDLDLAGAFDTYDEALEFASTNLETDTYLIQKCTAGDKEYAVHFPSRFFA